MRCAARPDFRAGRSSGYLPATFACLIHTPCASVVANAAPTMPASARNAPSLSLRRDLEVVAQIRMVGGDAAAQHDEIGPEQRVHAVQHVVELVHVAGPVELALHARAAGGARLGFHAVELEMAELGVGHQLAVDKQGAADAGAEAQHEHGAHDVARGAEVHFGEAGGVGVIDGDDLALEFGGGGLGQRLADPALATLAAVYTVPPTTTPGKVTPAGRLPGIVGQRRRPWRASFH